jgi:pycsar effector protein
MRDARPAGRRQRRKERNRMATEQEPLGGRQAYRAAQEVLVQGLDLWKMADNKARLSLLLLGPLNLILVLLLANRDVLLDLSFQERSWIMAGLVAYAALAMVMFLLAIGTLRPEKAAPVIGEATRERRHAPLGIRHYEDVLTWDLDDYQRAWRLVTREQLVEEVAEQAHAVAQANRRKFRTLYYLFRGLQGMTALALLLLLGIAAGLFLEGQVGTIRLKHGVELRVPAHRLSKPPAAGLPQARAPHGS